MRIRYKDTFTGCIRTAEVVDKVPTVVPIDLGHPFDQVIDCQRIYASAVETSDDGEYTFYQIRRFLGGQCDNADEIDENTETVVVAVFEEFPEEESDD